MEVQRNPSSVGLTRKCGRREEGGRRREADATGLSDPPPPLSWSLLLSIKSTSLCFIHGNGAISKLTLVWK